MIKQKGNTAIIAIIVGIIIIGAIIAIVRNNNRANELENTINSEQTEETIEINAASEENNENSQTSAGTAKQITVTYTSQGFNPATVTINEGDTVVFENNSNNSFWPASNDHPTHRIYSDFDPQKPIIPGQTYSFTFEETGTWGYHDHLRATQTGIIIVE